MSRPEAPRPAQVAGRFYPGTAQELRDELGRLMPAAPASPATALVGPHAGYMYSGAICGETYARVQVPARAIVLCPNHTGRGARRSIWSGGAWTFPGFQVEIDAELRSALLGEAGLTPDDQAHLGEHALEVHLPFLYARRPGVRIVPITLGGLDLASCRAMGDAIARVISEAKRSGQEVLLVASTDMSHYEPAPLAATRDRLAIDRMLALDPEGLYQTVREHEISMCGYVPTTVTLFASRALGASTGELIRYGNSGEASGDTRRVVGYAGLVVR